MKTKLLSIATWLLSVNGLMAQPDTIELRDFYMDFSTPGISAFSILDIEPSAISRPGNLKEFALGVTNFVNTKGDLRAGLAMEWAPFYTFNRKTGNWQNKSNNRDKFEWKNITLSFATTNDSTNVKLASALRFSPIDRTNPLNDKVWMDSISEYFYSLVKQREIQNRSFDLARKDFVKKVLDAYLKYKIPIEFIESLSHPIDVYDSYRMKRLKLKLDTLGTLYDRKSIANEVLLELKELFSDNGFEDIYVQNEIELMGLCKEYTDFFYQYHSSVSFSATFNQHILKMKEEYKKANWNKWALQLSAGGLFNSEKATLSDLNGQHYELAFTTGFPLIGKNWFKGTSFNTFMRAHSQLILQVKNQQYFTKDSLHNNGLFFGGRILLGNYDKRFSFEMAYIQQSNTTTDLNQSGFRYSVGTEIKIMDNYWLELAIGGQNFEDKSGVNILPRFAFRHAFGNENRYFKK